MRLSPNIDVLGWAIERFGAIHTLTAKFPKLNRWKSGEIQPTMKQLEDFARAVQIPFGYLLLPEPPEITLPIPHFRTEHDVEEFQPSSDLLESVYKTQTRQEWMRDYLINQGHSRLEFVGSKSSSNSSATVAKSIKRVLGIDDNWAAKIPNWTEALRVLRSKSEDAGILVVSNGVVGNNTHRVLDPEEFRGFVLVDDYAPLIFINGADYKSAQMFTLAHELAHVWVGSSAAFDLRNLLPSHNDVESLCDTIAAEFLVPEASLRELWEKFENAADPLYSLAKNYKASEIVAARRLLDIELIDRQEFFEYYDFWINKSRKPRQKMDGGDFYNNQNVRVGKKFMSAVAIAAKEGSLQYREAYKMTDLYGSTFNKYATEVLGFEY